MKIVTWNCNGAFRKKHSLIETLDPDLMIIQECEDPVRSTSAFRDWAGHHLWHGQNKNKGIGIFDRKNVGISRLNWDDEGLQSFLPCAVGDQFTLLAVWTKYADSPNFKYIGQLWKYMRLHNQSMGCGPLLVCGDLNSNTCWDEWDRWWNHSDVVRELERLGVTSIYHRFFEEAQGEESRPTLYHRKDLSKPYHVDYAFCTDSLFSPSRDTVAIGSADEWLEASDHMPMEFTVAR